MAKIMAVYGRLDCAHNNAGVEGALGPTADCTEDNWERVISVNLKGVWLCMQYEIARMLQQDGGTIVNTTSVAGLVGFQRSQAKWLFARCGAGIVSDRVDHRPDVQYNSGV
jgi:NAD(P)-dependent dehydrogenase (short-subunit alcohol dehydrogenase family)